jgi:hypothetical protein
MQFSRVTIVVREPRNNKSLNNRQNNDVNHRHIMPFLLLFLEKTIELWKSFNQLQMQIILKKIAAGHHGAYQKLRDYQQKKMQLRQENRFGEVALPKRESKLHARKEERILDYLHCHVLEFLVENAGLTQKKLLENPQTLRRNICLF